MGKAANPAPGAGREYFLTQEQLILGEQVTLPKLIQYFQEELGTYLRERVPYFAGLLGLPAPQIKLSQARTAGATATTGTSWVFAGGWYSARLA